MLLTLFFRTEGGTKVFGWILMVISVLMILGVGATAIWDGSRNG